MFKTRKQLKLEIEHLTEQLRIQSDERKKENARHNQQIKDLEDELKLYKQQHQQISDRCSSDEQEILDLRNEIDRLQPLDEENKRLNQELLEQKDINQGLISTVNELKDRLKKHLARIKTLEAKQGEKKPVKTKTDSKDPFAA